MNYSNLQQKLRDERNSGETNQTMADKAGISQSHMNRLLNGDAGQIGSLKFDTVLKLFPEIKTILERELGGQGAHQTASANGDGAAASVGGIAIAGGAIPDYQRVMNTIIDDQTICDTCKIRVLKIIKDA